VNESARLIRQASISVDEWVLRTRDPGYRWRQSKIGLGLLALEREAKVVPPAPTPAPVPTPSALTKLAQNVMFTAWNPHAGLRAPAKYTLAITADIHVTCNPEMTPTQRDQAATAYVEAAKQAAMTQRARGGKVACWGNQEQLPSLAIPDMGSRIGADYLIYQAETAAEAESAFAAVTAGYTQVVIGNPNSWGHQRSATATASITGREVRLHLRDVHQPRRPMARQLHLERSPRRISQPRRRLGAIPTPAPRIQGTHRTGRVAVHQPVPRGRFHYGELGRAAVSAVSPDEARKLAADALLRRGSSSASMWIEPLARALLSALDAAEQRGSEADSGGTAELSPVVGNDDEMVCARCERRHGVVWSAPSELWNAVMRRGVRGFPDEFGFCCPNCFMQLADERGIGNGTWVVVPDPLDGPHPYVGSLPDALDSEHGEAVLPASACPPPSVEALEAERDRLRREWLEPTSTGRKFRELRAGRDQAIKERDEAKEALAQIRSAWNAHSARCKTPVLEGVDNADLFRLLDKWATAPSDTASGDA
jgi:hypothetical protein